MLYLAPGHENISPEQLQVTEKDMLATEAGTQPTEMSLLMLVKYDTHQSFVIAKNMLDVAECTNNSPHSLHLCIRAGRDVNNFGSVHDAYVFIR